MPSLRSSTIAAPPADRVGRKRERERHPVRLPERLARAQDAVVAGGGLDGKAGGLEPADEFGDILPPLFSR
jgi:hypothetical protein